MLRLSAVCLASYVNRLAMSYVWGVFALSCMCHFTEGPHHAGSGASHHRFALMFAASPTGMARPNRMIRTGQSAYPNRLDLDPI